MLEIHPDRLNCFNDKDRPESFTLIISSKLKGNVKLHSTKKYQHTKIVYCNPNKTIQPILEKKELKISDILFSQYQYDFFQDLHLLDPTPTQRLVFFIDRKSTPMNMELAQLYFDIAYNTDINQIDLKNKLFLEKLGNSPGINYINPETKTHAYLKFTSDCLMTEIFGVLEPGNILIFPSGELALVHTDFANKPIPKLKINGHITLHGHPILQLTTFDDHQGFQYQKELFSRLFKLKDNPVIAKVKNGAITKLIPCTKDAEIPMGALEELFEIDTGYRTLIEFGHGLNSAIKLRDENTNVNELYANGGICVHFGIGSKDAGHLFHLDILCPDTKMKNDKGHSLMVTDKEVALKLKTKSKQKNRIKTLKKPQCPCD